MKLFALLDFLKDHEIRDVFEREGFLSIDIAEFEFVDSFFIAITKNIVDNEIIWNKFNPGLIITKENTGSKASLYKWSDINIDNEKFFVGSLFDREFILVNDWFLDYGVDKFDSSLYHKAFAKNCYMYILAEVIDHTADWCGHMSSVVHKL